MLRKGPSLQTMGKVHPNRALIAFLRNYYIFFALLTLV